MQLLERLQHHINKLNESNSEIAFIIDNGYGKRLKETIIYKNLSGNELRQFLRDEWRDEGARGLYIKGNWYWWNALGALHNTVAKKLNITDLLEINGYAIEVKFPGQLSNDYGDRFYQMSKGLDKKNLYKLLVYILRTLKALQKDYLMINKEEITEFILDLIRYRNQSSPEEYQYARMNKQQQHDYRKLKYDRQQNEYSDLFKRF